MYYNSSCNVAYLHCTKNTRFKKKTLKILVKTLSLKYQNIDLNSKTQHYDKCYFNCSL